MSALVGRFAQCVVAGTAPATAERQLAPYLSPSAARQVAAAGAPDPR